LLFGELYNHTRLRGTVQQFVDRKIVAPEDRNRFDTIIRSTHRLRDSWLAEAVMVILVFTLGHWVWRNIHLSPNMATWYAAMSSGLVHYTPAGYWFAFVAIPLYKFLTLRWLWRIALWYQFLWRVRGLPLRVNLFHPDKAAGLGFLEKSTLTFALVLLAQSATVASSIGNRIWHTGARLLEFKIEVATTVVSQLVLVVFPLTFFVITLERAKRTAGRDFGTLASAYVDGFHEKWIGGGLPQTGELLGNPDFQSLADVGNSYFFIREIRPIPISKGTLVTLATLVLAPMLPLLLTIMPLEQIVEHLLKAVL